MALLAVQLVALPVRAESLAISGLSIEAGEAGAEQLSFEANQPITPRKTFVLANPDRVVIDLPPASAAGLKLPPSYTGRLVRALRFGQFDANTSRLVLDVNHPVTIKSVTAGTPLVIELAPKAPLPEKAATAEKKQLPLIVIDAGHGGQDPGAIGLHDTHERDVTLNFARALKKALVATGRYRAALTRDGDSFIMLHDRVNIARKQKADILISLHADSNPKPEARGLSLYTLSATASDEEAAALAERENKADIITGIDLNTTDADVAGILIDLTQRETMNKSPCLRMRLWRRCTPKLTACPKPTASQASACSKRRMCHRCSSSSASSATPRTSACCSRLNTATSSSLLSSKASTAITRSSECASPA